MAITKEQARKVRQPTLIGDEHITHLMSGAGSMDIELSAIAEKVTMQSSDTLAYTYAVSANGKNFSAPVAGSANTLVTYSASLVKVVRIAWTSGAGRVTILAR